MPKRVLVVDSDPAFCGLLQQTLDAPAQVETARDVPAARARLLQAPFDLVVVNVAVGLEDTLALARVRSAPLPRVLAYGDDVDAPLVEELQHGGAFYEPAARIPFALSAYVGADLPMLDRRDAVRRDRRLNYRGGRRASDVPLGMAF